MIVAFFDPAHSRLFPGCPLLENTGFACPGCGLTRGFHELFHGDFLAALDFNLMVPVFAVGFIYLIGQLGSIALRGKGLKFALFTPAVLWTFLVVAVTFGVIRNLPFSPFNILFP